MSTVLDSLKTLTLMKRQMALHRTNVGFTPIAVNRHRSPLLSAARARGRLGGRKPVYPANPKVLMAQKMYQDRTLGIKEICGTLKISRATLYRYLKLVSS